MAAGQKGRQSSHNKQTGRYVAQAIRTAKNTLRNAARYGAVPQGAGHPKAGRKATWCKTHEQAHSATAGRDLTT